MTRAARGFTLIEVMIVIGIIGILSALAVSASGDYRRRWRFNEACREVYNGLVTARSEAQIKGTQVLVAFEPSLIKAWVDTNGNNSYDSTERLVYLYPPAGSTDGFPPGVTLAAPSLFLVSGSRLTLFDSRGFAVDPADATTFKGGTVVVTDSVLNRSRTVDFTLGGAVRISR